MLPTIATVLASADKAAQHHAQALEAHRAAHERYGRERVSQQVATATPAPAPYGVTR